MTTPTMTWQEAIRLPPEKPVKLPPADGGAVYAAQAWQDAISGRGHAVADQIGTAQAAESWRRAVDATPPATKAP